MNEYYIRGENNNNARNHSEARVSRRLIVTILFVN